MKSIRKSQIGLGIGIAFITLLLSGCSSGPTSAETLLAAANAVQLTGAERDISVTDSDASRGTCDAASLHVKVTHNRKSAYMSETSANLVGLVKLIRSDEEFSGFGLYYNGVFVKSVTDKFGNENVREETSFVDVCYTSYDLQSINLTNTNYLNAHVLDMASYDIKGILEGNF